MNFTISRRQLFAMIGGAIYQCAMVGILFNSSGVLLTQIRLELEFSMTYISMYNIIRSIAGALGASLLVSQFFKADNKGVYMMFVLGMILLGYMILVIGADTWLWYLTPVMICPISSLGVVAVPYILTEWFNDNAGFAIGVTMSSSGIGGAIFSPITAYLIQRFGWKEAIVILSAVSFWLGFVGVAFLFRKSKRQKNKEFIEKNMIKRKQYFCIRHRGNKRKKEKRFEKSFPKGRFLICSISMLGGCFCTQLVGYVSIYANSIGYSLAIGAILTSCIMGGNIIGKIIFGILSDKVGAWRAMILGVGSVLLGSLGLMLGGKNYVLLCLSAALFGLTYAISSIAISKCSMATYGIKTVRSMWEFIQE